MDEEELEQSEQSENKISVEKFFTRLEAVDAVANDAMEKAESSSVIIESQAKTIESLTQTIETLKADVKSLSDVINIRDKQDRDAEADRLLEEEDRAQKEEMEARALAVQEQGEAQGEQGQVEEEDREKGLLERIGDFFTDFLGGIVGAVGGLLLKTVGGIMLLGQKLIKGTKRGVGGVLDTLTFGLTDFDKRGGGGLNIFRRGREGELNEDGSKNVNYDPLAEKNISTPQALMEGINPVAKIMGMVDRSRKRKKRDEKIKKQEASSEYDETFLYKGDEQNVTGITKDGRRLKKGDEGFDELTEEARAFGRELMNQDSGVTAFAKGGPVFDNDEDKTNNDEDSVPAMLTPGEFVVTKDAVKKVGVDALKGLNASVGATNKANNLGTFEIKRLDAGDLSKDALVKKSSFMNNMSDVEISNESGTDYFREITDMSTGGLDSTTISRNVDTFTSEDGTIETHVSESRSRQQIVSIGVPDLIEHQDQLMGEINKLKGFENVTFDQFLNHKHGIPQDKLLPILMRSDAQKATSLKEDEAQKLDYEARGIKIGSGKGFSMSSGDPVGRTLKGTTGYRIGQILPTQYVSSKQEFTNNEKLNFSVGKPKESKPDPLLSDLSASINASVKGFNDGGYVTTDKRNDYFSEGEEAFDDNDPNVFRGNKSKQKLYLELMNARRTRGFNSPEANEIQKQIMILNGFPEESIYTDKEGKLQVKAFSTFGDETTVKDDRRGLFGVLGGVADSLTGNITDFDRRGGGIMGGSLIDALTLNLTDFDRKGGKPAGPMRMATGLLDAASGGLFDLDRRGGKPSGLMRGITGAIDHMSGNVLDLDRRGGEMKGLPRLIAGGLDRMTGNVTDFDRKGGEQFGLPRMAMGILDAATGNKFNFDQKSDSIPKEPESESYSFEEEYTKIGGERVIPGVPLSPLQRAVVTMGREGGTDYPDDIIDLYEMGGGAPEGNELQEYMKSKNEGVLKAAPQSKSKGLIKSITDFMFNTDAKNQKLSNAVQSAQNERTIDPASSPIQTEPGAAMMPAQPPQVKGTKIEPTAPNIPFIALLRGNAKRYMQDSSTGSDLASYLS